MFRNDASLSMEYRTIELENFSSVTPRDHRNIREIEKLLLFNTQMPGNFRMRGQHGEKSPVSGEITEGRALSSDRSGRDNLNERCSSKRDVPVLIEPVSRNGPGKKSVP